MSNSPSVNQSLYNRYRPTTYDYVVGQEDIIRSLRSIVSNKTFLHNRNFLFHSDSIGGVGKTTLANIFAKAINCVSPKNGDPCGNCLSCQAFDKRIHQDVIYADGTEYNTVDKVKPIIDEARHYPISTTGMRIIIIDEFQRMSPQAMSDFLTLFEFAQNRTIFMLTTTEINKVLQPIRTRCFKYELKPATLGQSVSKMAEICKSEHIDYTNTDLEKIYEESNGSLREAIQLIANYSDAYGNLVDLPINFKYSKFEALIEKSRSGDYYGLQDNLINMPMSNIYEDLSKFLFQRMIKTGCNKPIDSFLKYKPNDYNSVLLWLVQLNEDLNKTIVSNQISTSEPKKVYVPEVIKKQEENHHEVTSVMINYGFKED